MDKSHSYLKNTKFFNKIDHIALVTLTGVFIISTCFTGVTITTTPEQE